MLLIGKQEPFWLGTQGRASERPRAVKQKAILQQKCSCAPGAAASLEFGQSHSPPNSYQLPRGGNRQDRLLVATARRLCRDGSVREKQHKRPNVASPTCVLDSQCQSVNKY